jgi:hypothetical protein
MQTGAQLTAGFLLTLPFQPTFADLDSFQTGLYLALVLLAALTTALVMTPVAVHRRLSGEHVKERLVITAHWAMMGVLTCISLLLVGMPLLIFDVVLGPVDGADRGRRAGRAPRRPGRAAAVPADP